MSDSWRPDAGDGGVDPSDAATPLFGFWRPTDAWMRANLFRLIDAGVRAFVAREGDPVRGAVMIVFDDDAGGCRVLVHVRASDGESIWIRAHAEERLDRDGAASLIDASTRRDPDLWILRIDESQFNALRARLDSAGDSAAPSPPARGRNIIDVLRDKGRK